LEAGHHQQNFDFSEEVLPIGVLLLARLIQSCPTWDVKKSLC
jgi:metal-dependent amidase/aminoacylase/carboxypeptidase family protein